ncbi:MAG: hypothetical protein M1812_000924 [Candelaria pacifica]|nr:MAG: hypothetical protein M1812_000924 [Candelaria pacifica]
MWSEPEGSSWDLTPVFNLINSLSSGKGTPAHHDTARSTTNAPYSDNNDLADSTSGLGDFSRLWDYLGQPQDLPPPTFEKEDPLVSKRELGLNGLVEISPVLKGVRWRDEVDGTDLEDIDQLGRGNLSLKSAKKQRKLANRLRRSQELVQQLEAKKGNPRITKLPSDIESDNDLQRLRPSPAQRANLHHISSAIQSNAENRSLHYSSSPPSSTSPAKSPPIQSPVLTWPVSNPNRLNPACLPWVPPRSHIEPLIATSGPNKKAKLTQSLIRRFESEKKSLMNPFPLHNPTTAIDSNASGLHVFVDASNIMIGFHDTLKRARGIPVSRYIRRVPFSFHCLALIMERGRQTAKRVLVGSSPHVPAFDEAKQLGYETSILDRVHKAKELTPRQKKYRNGYGTSGQSSGSETTVAFAPEKWVEQAVDEILHLKILESLVDAAEPSTIILATGDAAEAEYSEGFLRMVERALEKGWSIELISFAQSISFAYRKKEFRQKWGKRFQIIELDEFCEELLAL